MTSHNDSVLQMVFYAKAPETRRQRLASAASKSFAAKDYCTFGQAKRVIEDLNLPPLIQPYAYVAVCHQSELEKFLHLSADDYKRLRADLVDLFNLSSPDFKIKDLLKERLYDQGNSAHVSLAGGYTIEGHGGGGTDGGRGSGAG